MKCKFFVNPTPSTLEELKSMYRKLAFQHHPDCGGDTETMQAINAEYDALFSALKDVHKNAQGETYYTQSERHENPETPNEFRDLIEKLIHIPGITVELCGSWLWVTGNTRPVADQLKAAGFRFSGGKQAWYYHRGPYRKHGKSEKTMDEIRAMYDSYTFTGSARENRGGEVVSA